MIVQEKIYSAQDLWELSSHPDYADMRLELSEGGLLVMPLASFRHGTTASRLALPIARFVEENDLGEVTAAETGFILFQNPNGKDTVRAPDVGFVAKGRLPDDFEEGYAPLAPDLAVEVVSPNDSAEDIEKKVQEYLRYGTRLIWVAYPATQTVTAHTPTHIQRLTAEDMLDGGDVLPGFRLAVKAVFGK